MKSLVWMALLAVGTAACGKDEKSAAVQPQINSKLLGSWRSDCLNYRGLSRDSDILFKDDGTTLSVDNEYKNADCQRPVFKTSSTRMRYEVLNSGIFPMILRLTDIQHTPPAESVEKVVSLTMEVSMPSDSEASHRTIKGTVQDESGVIRELSAIELALLPVLNTRKISN